MEFMLFTFVAQKLLICIVLRLVFKHAIVVDAVTQKKNEHCNEGSFLPKSTSSQVKSPINSNLIVVGIIQAVIKHQNLKSKG